MFGRLPVASESVARSRSYGLPGVAASGRDADLTVLAALGKDHVQLLAGAWPGPVAAPQGAGAQTAATQVAVPRAALVRLGLAESALPAPVRLDDRFGGPPLTVLVTGVYRAAEPDAAYWRLDPLGGREVQADTFAIYGPLLVDDSAFTTGGLLQDHRLTLLTPDLRTVRADEAEAVRTATDPASATLERVGSLRTATELPKLLAELSAGTVVARSTLLMGALQLTVLSTAALLLVAHILTVRQEPERVLLTARGASRRRLGALTATESLLLALPAAVLAPLLTPPLLRLFGRFGPLGRVHLEIPDTWLVWPVAGGCALACVLLTTLPSVLRGASAAVLRRVGSRQALVTGAARSGVDLAVLVLAVLGYQQLARYGGTDAPASGASAGGALGVDPVLVAAPPWPCAAARCWSCACCRSRRGPGDGWRRAAGAWAPPSSAGSSPDGPAGPPGPCCCSYSPSPAGSWRSASTSAGPRPSATRPTSRPPAACGSPAAACPRWGRADATRPCPAATASFRWSAASRSCRTATPPTSSHWTPSRPANASRCARTCAAATA